MKTKAPLSARSPKNKFRATITYDRALKEIGGASSTGAMTVSELKDRVSFYTDQAKRNRVGSHVQIFENKKEYPDFNWVKKESYRVKI